MKILRKIWEYLWLALAVPGFLWVTVCSLFAVGPRNTKDFLIHNGLWPEQEQK